MDTAFLGSRDGRADLDVAIIGAGFSGIGMAIALKKGGYRSFCVFEKASDLGGTWRDNHYPGCACDVPSHLYSFSFEQNPNWSRAYSPQPEIWRYMKDCASKYGILRHIRFDATIVAARFDETQHIWRITLANGETVTARALISAVGALHLPHYPAIKGIESFRGSAFHSSEWNDGLDLSGLRVGVVGTGASAIQIAPSIAPRAAHLALFQRTPAWVLPRQDAPIPTGRRELFRKQPLVQRLFRNLLYWDLEMRVLGFLGHRRVARQAEKFANAYRAKQIADPALRKALTPEYRLGCKRVLISDDYYTTFNRPNVSLVTSSIDRATETGLVTADGQEHALDVIVYATGFRANEPLAELEIAGRGGHTLAHDWRYGAQAYYGMTVAGFPNFFMLLGPNTGLGHNSIIFMIEAQIGYIMHCLAWLTREDADEVEIRRGVQDAFNARLKAKLEKTVWQSGCRSWYLNENGTNSTIWPDFTFRYWWRTRHPDPEDFVFTLPKRPVPDYLSALK